MATSSGTTVFEKTFTIDEIIEESYERIGLVNNTGNQMKAARRSLNIMFQEWGNRGLHYWEVAENSISMVEGQTVYTIYRSSSDGTSDGTFSYLNGGINASVTTLTLDSVCSAELLDRVPIFTGSMARNFLLPESLSDRFFTLMAFLHLIGLPLFLVFAIWLHVFRISRPSINPPRALMAGSLLAMLAVSFAFPALSQDKVDLATVPQKLGLDWYYLLVYPLAQIWSPGAVWALLGGVSLLLFFAPWVPPARTPPVAVVDLHNCNGCGRCVDDCPYGAIAMQPRSDGTRYSHEAVVEPSLCLSCGICVGACPPATPIRKASTLKPAIDLPDINALLLRETFEARAALLQGRSRVVVFGCDGSRDLARLEDGATAVRACSS